MGYQKYVRKMLKKHTLQKIIKLSEETFQSMSSTTISIFIFKAGEPQNNKPVFACYRKKMMDLYKSQIMEDTFIILIGKTSKSIG